MGKAKDSASRIFVQAEFSCKPKAIANLFDIAEVQPKMESLQNP